MLRSIGSTAKRARFEIGVGNGMRAWGVEFWFGGGFDTHQSGRNSNKVYSTRYVHTRTHDQKALLLVDNTGKWKRDTGKGMQIHGCDYGLGERGFMYIIQSPSSTCLAYLRASFDFKGYLYRCFFYLLLRELLTHRRAECGIYYLPSGPFYIHRSKNNKIRNFLRVSSFCL